MPFLSGLGLAGPAGLNAYIPLLVLALALVLGFSEARLGLASPRLTVLLLVRVLARVL